MSETNANTGSRIGEKIRSFRIMRHLTQKQLAEECGLSESAIRNYELGNRYPDEYTLMDIADALLIDRAVLRDPDPTNPLTVEQFLYALEKLYGFSPKLVDGELCFTFGNTPESFSDQQVIDRYLLADLLYTWCGIRDLMVEGKITQEEYHEWQIAHSDVKGTDIDNPKNQMPMAQRMEMETARRNLGLVPTPVFDENHVNVMPIPPRKKGDNKPFPEEKKAEELVKQKRKRKPKNK